MEETQTNELLLKLIPEERLSPAQRSFERSPFQDVFPMYSLLREPTNLDEFDWKKKQNGIEIWRENSETILSIGLVSVAQYEERHLNFALQNVSGGVELNCVIYGKTDAAIAETFAFFCSLQHEDAGPKPARLVIWDSAQFDWSALLPEQLAQILDADPARHFHIHTGTWTAEQSVILASRPYPLSVRLISGQGERYGGFAFQDHGTAFVTSLEQRSSSFGSLCIVGVEHDSPLSCHNLERLLELEGIFESLSLNHGRIIWLVKSRLDNYCPMISIP